MALWWSRGSKLDMNPKTTFHKNQDMSNEPKGHHAETNSSPLRARITSSTSYLLWHLVDMFQIRLRILPPRQAERNPGVLTSSSYPDPCKGNFFVPPSLNIWEMLSPPRGSLFFFFKSDLKWKPPASHHHPCLTHQTHKG